MEEEIIIVSKPSKQTQMMVLAVGIACLLLFILCFAANIGECRVDNYWWRASENSAKHYGSVSFTLGDCFTFYNESYFVDLILYVGLFITALGLVIYYMLKDNEITVTDKRVYGRRLFGNPVDIPFDSVSAIGISALKGIDVSCSSGVIKFKGIQNAEEIQKVISSHLIDCK